LAELIDALPDIVFVISTDATLIDVNDAGAAVLGWSRDDWLGKNALELIHHDDLGLVQSSIDALANKRFGTPIELRVRTSDQRWKWLEVVGASLGDGATDAGGMLCVARDITKRRVLEVAQGELNLFQQVVQHAASITLLLDRKGTIRSVSGAFTRLLGHDPTDVVGASLSAFATPTDRATVEAARREALRSGQTSRCEASMRMRRGGARPIRFEFVDLLDDPVVGGVVVTGHDISDLQAARSELQHLAQHDGLTGSANRAALVERMAQLVALSTPMSVLFIGLDRFKPVNDLYGHHAGDRVLTEVATRLRHCTRPADLVARVGGDEFVVLATGAHDATHAERLAERIERDLARPYVLDVGAVRVTASVGVATSDLQSTTTGLLADADAAMHEAKQAKRGAVGSSRRASANQRRQLLDELSEGIDRGELVAYLQPIVDTVSGHVVAFEALARWVHPRLGVLPPAQFLDLAEEASLDLALGDAVFDSACATYRQLGIAPEVHLAVNLSVSQLLDPTLTARMRRTASRHRISMPRISCEITESATLPHGNATSGVESTLRALRAAGAQLALDDFGTGYSSLTHVGRFPISTIKIDRSFVEGVLERPEDRAVIAAVVGLARTLSLSVVAEGVESPAQLAALRDLGCSALQGYLLGAPMSPPELSAWWAGVRVAG
jgi:diguanylate cyclase (GGDEF)-like protein/PAS domain S-box-containing protein